MTEPYRRLPDFGTQEQLAEMVAESESGDLMAVSRAFKGIDRYYGEEKIYFEVSLGRIAVPELVEEGDNLFVPASSAIRKSKPDKRAGYVYSPTLGKRIDLRDGASMAFVGGDQDFFTEPVNYNELYEEDPEFYDTKRPTYEVVFASRSVVDEFAIDLPTFMQDGIEIGDPAQHRLDSDSMRFRGIMARPFMNLLKLEAIEIPGAPPYPILDIVSSSSVGSLGTR